MKTLHVKKKLLNILFAGLASMKSGWAQAPPIAGSPGPGQETDVCASLGSSSGGGYPVPPSLRGMLLDRMASGQEALDRSQVFRDQKRPVEALPLLERSLSDLVEVEVQARGHRLHESVQALHRHLEGAYAMALFEAGQQDEGHRLELWARAAPLLENAAMRDPSVDIYRNLLVDMAEHREDALAAGKARNALQRLETPVTSERYKQALRAFNARRYVAARTELRKALGELPVQAEVHYLVGLTEIQLGHRTEALVAFRCYLECAPEGARARSVRAFVRTLMSKPPSGAKGE